jgi:hypothetical protein
MSAAALGFSLAFLSDFTGDDEVLWPLVSGWVAFAVSVIAVLITFELNAIQLKPVMRRIDEWIGDPRGRPEPDSGVLWLRPKAKKWRAVDVINSVSVYALIAGLGLTIFFAVVNL